jgi:hypothetical protein
MRAFILSLRWMLRLAGLAALALGAVLWTGHGFALIRGHILLGFLTTFALLLLSVGGLFRRVNPELAIGGILWALLLPVVGFGQLNWMPGVRHWLIDCAHLLMGILAIGVGEIIAARALRDPVES